MLVPVVRSVSLVPDMVSTLQCWCFELVFQLLVFSSTSNNLLIFTDVACVCFCGVSVWIYMPNRHNLHLASPSFTFRRKSNCVRIEIYKHFCDLFRWVSTSCSVYTLIYSGCRTKRSRTWTSEWSNSPEFRAYRTGESERECVYAPACVYIM